MDNEIKEMFNVLLTEVRGMRTDVNELKTDVAELKTRVDENTREIAELKADVAELKTCVDENTREIAELKERTDINTRELNELKVVIESDLTHNIQVIAEGHGLYIDKYNDMRKAVDKVRTTQELMEIRLTMMEGDVRALKARGKAEPVCRT